MSRCSPPSPLDDCNKDPSYIPLPATPPQEGMSQTYSTPPGHRPGSKTTTAAKKKLSEVATVPNRCLVTLAEQPLEHCHIIPRTIRLEKMWKLETAWYAKLGSLNAQTTANMLYLTADMHTMFDGNDWGLLPIRDHLQDILFAHATDHGARFDDFTTQSCRYHFIPFNVRPWVFSRMNQDSESYQTFSQPFDDFPSLVSHIHPFFAICDVAKKEIDRRAIDFDKHLNPSPRRLLYKADLDCSITLYQMWLGPVTPRNTSLTVPETASHSSSPHPSGDRPEQASQGSQGQKRKNQASGFYQTRSQTSSSNKRRRETPGETDRMLKPDAITCETQTSRPLELSLLQLAERPRAHSLPTPEHTHDKDSKVRLSGDAIPPLEQPLSVMEWVARVLIFEDENVLGDESAERALADYRREGAQESLN